MPFRTAVGLLTCLLTWLLVATGTGRASAAGDTALTLPLLATPPVVDGRLEPDEWQVAVKVELPFQVEPGDNAPASEKTEAWLARDDQHLYLAFQAHDTDSQSIRARVTRRDDIDDDDYVIVMLDTYNDHVRAYRLSFNPLGIQSDGFINQEGDVDNTWDGIFRSKGRVTANGYVVEIAIPFKTLRFRAGKDAVWGLHLQRWIARKAERTSWQPVSRQVSNLLVQSGELRGFDDLRISRTLDVVPIVIGSLNDERRPDGRVATFRKAEAGLTVAFSITPNITLTATANPDFSQVEADTPQVNVNQRFILFFPERRPFFLEGQEFFRSLAVNEQYNGLSPFNSRTIVDPDWGAKLTGKVGRNTFAFLAASDRAPGKRVAPGQTGAGANALFLVGRYQRDFWRDSAIGGFFTRTHWAGTTNQAAAVDTRVRVRSDTTLRGQFTQTQTTTPDGLTQRGKSFTVNYSLFGRNWRIFADHQQVDPTYRNDAGFVDRTGYQGTFAEVGYAFRPVDDRKWYAEIWPFVQAYRSQTSTGFPELQNVKPGIDVTLRRGIFFYAGYEFNRDGFAGRVLSHRAVQLRHSVTRFKRLTFSGNLSFGTGLNLDPSNTTVGRRLDLRETITFRPNERLNLELLYLKSRLRDQRTRSPFFDQNIFRLRTTYQFTQNTSFRGLFDYDSAARRFGLSVLYAYNPYPNTAVFVGYNDLLFNGFDPIAGRRTPGLFRQARTFFFKLSYNFRL
ncbi:carbohydrate binding family 9 domain-containing protein [Chloracidobacterium aggregatum]|uniref:Carbohydrate binding family 9 domain-containing protein n=1 Tax=Chloracidobacterium sp. N TaxID=2821540 RepID=A0ABX8AZF5_9BACT|nr:carbohydrate binding family 9 domain-containing protein [Chloracidobacterium aggregatum]QUV85608.1 carbohydrate binding family 9 domain-containing protein [Chloracidobacterium sp. 2]QUV87989.1 carbohydrate binding family 9 domain-containing protein [Chloracidobacterium sp. S]QUV94099.1 carbohydrate binding family 9 domain-containing protein [Chloracidobacterium sp. N]QUV97296.1 carbohydrate binding family 9 domain-containing protein [Chloracidobacterium sp. E]